MITTIIQQGTPIEKKELLGQLCSNLTLTDKIVSPVMFSEVQTFIDGLNRAKDKNPLFEPRNIIDTSSRNPVFTQVIPSLLRTLDDVRNSLG